MREWLILLMILAAVPGYWMAQAWVLACFILLLLTIVLWLCNGCCCATRVACCVWGSTVKQGRYRREYIDGRLVHEEEIS